jgi:hypothetical protein
MNIKKKEAAVKKYFPLLSEKSIEEVTELIKADEKGYAESEVAEIAAALLEGPKTVQDSPKKSPNAGLDLSAFNYKELTGKKFKEYVELVGDRNYTEFDSESGEEKSVNGTLLLDDVYDFVQHRVDVVMKARFPGVKDTPYDFNGLRVKNDTPEHTTRISVRHALEFNLQILNAHSRAGHGKYYFLKK